MLWVADYSRLFKLTQQNPGNMVVLVNAEELVGINCIYSQTGNFTGYAFAINFNCWQNCCCIKEYGSTKSVFRIQVQNIEGVRKILKAENYSKKEFGDDLQIEAKVAGMEK